MWDGLQWPRNGKQLLFVVRRGDVDFWNNTYNDDDRVPYGLYHVRYIITPTMTFLRSSCSQCAARRNRTESRHTPTLQYFRTNDLAIFQFFFFFLLRRIFGLFRVINGSTESTIGPSVSKPLVYSIAAVCIKISLWSQYLWSVIIENISAERMTYYCRNSVKNERHDIYIMIFTTIRVEFIKKKLF